MQTRLARRTMAIQLHCGGVASRYGDSSYVSSSLTADRQQELLKAFLTADRSKINPKQSLVTSICSQGLTRWLTNRGKEDAENQC